MSSHYYCGNTSQVTSGYSCCNNLLVQVTPLNQPNYFLLMTYRASQAAINGLWPKQGMKESLKCTVWQQILQKSKVTDQKPHVTATLNWRKGSRTSARSHYCLWRLSIFEVAPQPWKGSCFCSVNAAWYSIYDRMVQSKWSSWALNGHPFQQWLGFCGISQLRVVCH